MHAAHSSVSSTATSLSISSNDDDPVVVVQSAKAWTTARAARPAVLIQRPARHHPSRPHTPPETPKQAPIALQSRHKVTKSITKVIERVKSKSSLRSTSTPDFATHAAPPVPPLPTSFSFPSTSAVTMTQAERGVPSIATPSKTSTVSSFFTAVSDKVTNKRAQASTSSLAVPANDPFSMSTLSLASTRTDGSVQSVKAASNGKGKAAVKSLLDVGSWRIGKKTSSELDLTRRRSRDDRALSTASDDTLELTFDAFDLSAVDTGRRSEQSSRRHDAFAFPQSRVNPQTLDRDLPPLPLSFSRPSLPPSPSPLSLPAKDTRALQVDLATRTMRTSSLGMFADADETDAEDEEPHASYRVDKTRNGYLTPPESPVRLVH